MALITLPSGLVAHTSARAADVMADLNAIVNQVNGNLDASNLKDGAVAASKLGSVPRALVAQTGSKSLPTSATTRYSPFDVESYDTDSMVDLVAHNDRITVTTAGVYIVVADVIYDYAADGARRITDLVQFRSTTAIAQVTDARINVGNAGLHGSTQVVMTLPAACNAGDFFVVQGYQDSGGGITWSANMMAARIGSL